MLIGCVVKNEVEAETDPGLAQIRGQFLELWHRAQAWIDGTVIADGVAAVTFALRHFEQRHQMQVGQSQFLKVGDPGAQPVQIARQQIDVADRRQHPLGSEPLRILKALPIQCLEIGGASEPTAAHFTEQLLKMIEKIIMMAVEDGQAREQFIEI